MTLRILGTKLDYEAVATAIWLECWEGIGSPKHQTEVQVSWSFVRNRCYDFKRRQKIEQRATQTLFDQKKKPANDHIEAALEVLKIVMSRAKLSQIQTEIVSRIYLLDQALEQVSKALALTKRVTRLERDKALTELKRISQRLTYD